VVREFHGLHPNGVIAPLRATSEALAPLTKYASGQTAALPCGFSENGRAACRSEG
jgi:hypothetical protein